jgi:hypothetical protein
VSRRVGRLRDAIDQAATAQDLRDLARRLREALVDATAGVADLRAAVERTDAALAAQGRQRADAERRGRLARDVQDLETEAVAARYAAKHAEQEGRLARRAADERAALAEAERELLDLRAELKRAERGGPTTSAERSAERAWRTLRAATGVPEDGGSSVPPEAGLRRATDEVAVEQQLREIKRRLKS